MTSRRKLTSFLALLGAVTLTACGAETFEPGLHLISADPVGGVAGYYQAKTGDARIDFRSGVVNNVLTSEIRDARGQVLAIYLEDGVERPNLRILDAAYGVYGDPAFEKALERLAGSPEGALVQSLAYELVTAAPGDDLIRPRRGLEVPYQAMQGYLKVLSARHANNSDYYASADQFAVKSVDHRLILKKNWIDRDSMEAAGGGNRARDDESRVGYCFGRCGGGCGSWSHYGHTLSSEYLDSYDIDTCGGWCNEYTVTWELVHQTCGCATSGCAAHDWCVRNLCGGDAWCAPCDVVAIWTGITAISCLWMSDTCWSYADPPTQGIDTQCFPQCGADPYYP